MPLALERPNLCDMPPALRPNNFADMLLPWLHGEPVWPKSVEADDDGDDDDDDVVGDDGDDNNYGNDDHYDGDDADDDDDDDGYDYGDGEVMLLMMLMLMALMIIIIMLSCVRGDCGAEYTDGDDAAADDDGDGHDTGQYDTGDAQACLRACASARVCMYGVG